MTKRTRRDISKEENPDALGKEDILEELGQTGLYQFSGFINEEFLNQLKGHRKTKIFKEMRDNDPVVGAILFATDMLLRNVVWRVEPKTEAPIDEDAKEFVESCMDDMEHTWTDLISEVLSMLPFGFSTHELVYKQRQGPDAPDKENRSEFKDGKIGWRKIPIRSQDTLYRWLLDDTGEILGFEQRTRNFSGTATIPWEKMLLFRTNSHKNNPEGRSVLRNAYRPWYFKKRIEEIEGIGIERDLAGLPMAYVPPEIMLSNATAPQKALYNAIKDIIRNVRRNEQEGVVFPLVYDDKGNKLYEMELLSTGGKRNFDTTKIITRYDQRIAMVVLADFILLGHDKVGSFALSSDKTNLYATTLGAWLKSIADVFNRHALPRLFQINNMSLENLPTLVPGDIESKDIEKWTTAIERMVNSGMLIYNEESEKKIAEELDLPAPDENGREIPPVVPPVIPPKIPKEGDE